MVHLTLTRPKDINKRDQLDNNNPRSSQDVGDVQRGRAYETTLTGVCP